MSHVITDPKRLTALAILGIRDRDTFPLLFYRDHCADMAIAAEDFDAQFIASSLALCVSGTHLSQPQTYAACVAAMREARNGGHTRRARHRLPAGVVGPDQPRPRGAPIRAVERSQRASANGDSVVRSRGRHRGGNPHRRRQHRHDCRVAAPARTHAGHAGGQARADGLRRVPGGNSRQASKTGLKGPGFPVDVYNILGAGDAFMAGFLRGWIRDEALERCCAYANACGALVVSRHGCAPAMPSWIELNAFLEHGSPTRRLREDAQLERLHRNTTRTRQWGDLAVLAFDHRVQFVDMAAPHGAGHDRIVACKKLIAEGARQGADGVERRRRHPRRSLRRRDISRRHRLRAMGRAAGRDARFATADVRSGQRAGNAPAHVARRTRRQVPRLHAPGRPAGLAPSSSWIVCANCRPRASRLSANS